MVPGARGSVASDTLSHCAPAEGCPIAGGQLGPPVKAGVGAATLRCQSQPDPPHKGGRGTSKGEDTTMVEERAPSLPSLQSPGTCAPSPGTRGRQRGSTRRVPSPPSCWRSGWACSPAPRRVCRRHPALQRGSGNCTLPRGEGLSARGGCGSIPGHTQVLRDVPTEP